MNSSKEQYEREIAEMESQLKDMKRQYKKIMKSVKGNASDDLKAVAKRTKQYIKAAEKDLKKAKLQVFINY